MPKRPPDKILWVVNFAGEDGEESFLMHAASREDAIRRACRVSGRSAAQLLGAAKQGDADKKKRKP